MNAHHQGVRIGHGQRPMRLIERTSEHMSHVRGWIGLARPTTHASGSIAARGHRAGAPMGARDHQRPRRGLLEDQKRLIQCAQVEDRMRRPHDELAPGTSPGHQSAAGPSRSRGHPNQITVAAHLVTGGARAGHCGCGLVRRQTEQAVGEAPKLVGSQGLIPLGLRRRELDASRRERAQDRLATRRDRGQGIGRVCR